MKKKIRLQSWMLYAFVFILLLGIRVVLGRLDPRDDADAEGNLLVNVVCAALMTAGFADGHRYMLRNRKSKEEVERRLKDIDL